MPPLERFPSPVGADHYLSEVDAHLYAKGSHETRSRIDLRQVAVHAHRDLIIQTNPLLAPTEEPTNDNAGTTVDWIDLFTRLCTCQTSTIAVLERPRKRAAVGSSKNIMYPVARYPDRLNSPQLVERRRKSLEKHLTFRPVEE